MEKTFRRRDILLREFAGGWCIISCDSCGSIGQKPGDAFQTDNQILGRFSVRVPILEIMAVGGEVIAVADAVSNEMEPTGREIIAGIGQELAEAGIAQECLTGSTEENFPSVMTAVGVTAVGFAQQLKLSPAEPGDILLCFGRPHVGAAVLEHPEEILSYQRMRELVRESGIREISPAGSGGVGKECEELAQLHGMEFEPAEHLLFSLWESCGPSCCAVAVASPDTAERLLKRDAVLLGCLKKAGKQGC